MSYYKEDKLYSEMSVEELKKCRQKHISNPKYFLQLIKPPFYWTWLAVLDNKIKKKQDESISTTKHKQ